MTVAVAVKRSAAVLFLGLLEGCAPALQAQAPTHTNRATEQLDTEQLDTVHMATSCGPSAQLRFDEGFALLHAFEFALALRAFKESLRADPSCAMATMRTAAVAEDRTEKNAVTPGALAQFAATLSKAPDCFRTLTGAGSQSLR